MKLKEKFQRFWTLSKSHEGFTLVELIVVIAILAILAGVAIPVYNGYIKKANTAADQTILDSINTAFVAACVDNGFTQYDVKDGGAVIAVGADGTLGALTQVTHVDGTDITGKIKPSFDMFFAGNAGAKFNTFRSLNFAAGMFSGSETVSYGAYTNFFSALKGNDAYKDYINATKDSTLSNDVGATMGVLKDVTGIAAGMAGEGGNAAVQNVLDSDGFHASAMGALGITDASELNTKLGTLAATMMEKNPGMTEAQALAQVKANAAVLYTAQQTAGMTPERATELFNSATSAGILQKMSSDDDAVAAEGMAQAALVCGMYTQYINREGSTATDKTVNVENVLAALESDTGFQNYLAADNTQGQKDLAGYLGALNIINSTTGGQHAAEVENLMVNGFGDASLIAGLEDLLG